ncbi:SirB2 family protein [Microbulbifer taiwanensis]|uniref:SirB2 family protein n=1 Tax=Microbulbifer taiwanensis TaxID=986746 RepID=A0ABW1YGL4_9GAMM|nr:SirB2 family protein [Microbulbifer taiwanensis]
MASYSIVKLIHITCAVLSISLFALRVGLDAGGKSQWRRSPLRWVPHVNDSLLLTAAIVLVFLGGWNPLTNHWLAAKILLLFGYIAAGMVALRQTLERGSRLVSALVALLLVALIFYLAMRKPELFQDLLTLN